MCCEQIGIRLNYGHGDLTIKPLMLAVEFLQEKIFLLFTYHPPLTSMHITNCSLQDSSCLKVIELINFSLTYRFYTAMFNYYQLAGSDEQH